MIGADGRYRCDVCGRILADSYPYHKCQNCQERQIARRKSMERIDAQLAESDARWADRKEPTE